MIRYPFENLALAMKDMEHTPHLDVLRKRLPEIFECDYSNEFSKTGKFPFTAAVFNIERGAYLKQILSYFQYHILLKNVDVIFANEVDCGMARTGSLDIPLEIAKALDMNYAYAVEFLSLEVCRDGAGSHGNAIFSRFPLSRVKTVRLPIKYEWFYWEGERRLGTRCAVFAEIEPAPGKKMGLVSVHLENRTTGQGRREQMEFLLNEIDLHFGKGIPVLLGGDLNTLCFDGKDRSAGTGISYLADHPGDQLRHLGQVPAWEPLLDYAASRGFSYKDCNILEKPTCRDAIKDGRTVLFNLDWFLCRGASCSDPERVESIFRRHSLVDAPPEVFSYYGQELADHDIVLITCGT